MDIKKIRELVKIMESSAITELTVKDAETEITLSKKVSVVAAPVSAAAPAASTPAPVIDDKPPVEESILITAPIVGTF